jgi:CHAD domain-containing protein
VQQLEQEVKLEVPPGWSVPDLTGVIPGAQAGPAEALSLEATYYDTPDLRLARHRLTLRFRQETELPTTGGRKPGPARGEWTLKLPEPGDGTVLARQELTWPPEGTEEPGSRGPASKARPRRATAGGAGADVAAPPLHPGPAALVRGIALGHQLVPIAYLATVRQRTVVSTSDGRHLAEVDFDTVAGRRLLVPNGAPSEVTRFEEVEVELAPGSAVEVLEAVVGRLRSAGAKRSNSVSKLKTVLGDMPAGDGAHAHPAKRPAVLAEAMQEQARACLDQLLEHDVALRLDKPDMEHVHKARVAVRRFRTVLRSFYSYLYAVGDGPTNVVGNWLGSATAELRWLGQVLGQARDTDVRSLAIEQQCLRLPDCDTEGCVQLVSAARADQLIAHTELLEALESDRYLGALHILDALGNPRRPTLPGQPGTTEAPTSLWDSLTGSAAIGARRMARKEWRALRKAVRRLGDAPADEALHRVRIKAKRLRYLAEVAEPLLPAPSDRKGAQATIAAATRLQDVLGNVHDEAVTERWLREAGRQGVAVALAAGQLIGAARQRQQEGREQWAANWKDLSSKKNLEWLG